jgi:hypothetical protein
MLNNRPILNDYQVVSEREKRRQRAYDAHMSRASSNSADAPSTSNLYLEESVVRSDLHLSGCRLEQKRLDAAVTATPEFGNQ